MTQNIQFSANNRNSTNTNSLMYPQTPNSSMATISIGSPTRASPKGAQAKQPPGLIPVSNNIGKSHVGYITKEVELLRESSMNLASANAHALAQLSHNAIQNQFDTLRQKSVITSRSSMDVIDLSSPPRSQMAAVAYQQPGRSVNMLNSRNTSTDSGLTQVSHRGSSIQQQQAKTNEKYQVIPQPNANNFSPSYASYQAYKVQKAVLENTTVSCININAYSYNDLLITITDLKDLFFPHMPSLDSCKRILAALDIQLYKGNR